MRVFVTGPCGAGKTTTGRLLANAMDCSGFDLDDLFHMPTEPPFQTARPLEERFALAEALFLPKASWVLSGNGLTWIAPIVPHFDAVVLLEMRDPAARVARVKARERKRFGDRIDPGGDMHQTHMEFLQWIADHDGDAQETKNRHSDWLPTLPCPVLRVDAGQSQDDVVQEILTGLAGCQEQSGA